MITIIEILNTWIAGLGNGMRFFLTIFREVVSSVSAVLHVYDDLPYFLCTLIGIGLFVAVGNIVLKII